MIFSVNGCRSDTAIYGSISSGFFFFGILQRRIRRATFYVFISQSLLSAPLLFSIKKLAFYTLFFPAAPRMLTPYLYVLQYYTENASIRHLTRITPLFKARIFKMDCQFDGNCKKGRYILDFEIELVLLLD